MKKVSTAFLMGGLGNQMFQAAHALAQGKKNNLPTKFKCESWTPMQGKQTIEYKDNIFSKLDFTWEETTLTRHNEFSWSYSELQVDWSTSVEFYGYFQSSKHFLGFDDYIRKTFQPTEKFIEDIHQNYPQIKEKNTLSIHIRMGDYKQNPHIHPTISIEYINKSIELIGEYSHVFVFTDDKKWAKNNLNLERSTIVEEDDWVELWMISLCQNNIISNSTFSWWGSFLNRNDEKKVLAPSLWFGPSGPQNYKDIYEPYWTLIDVIYDNGLLK